MSEKKESNKEENTVELSDLYNAIRPIAVQLMRNPTSDKLKTTVNNFVKAEISRLLLSSDLNTKQKAIWLSSNFDCLTIMNSYICLISESTLYTKVNDITLTSAKIIHSTICANCTNPLCSKLIQIMQSCLKDIDVLKVASDLGLLSLSFTQAEKKDEKKDTK